MELILASSSPARHQLLKRLQIPFSTHSPEIDESPRPNELPQNMAYRLAEEKARALQHIYTEHLIIGSDQVATLNGIDCIGKPHKRSQALKQLKSLSGQRLTFFTAVSLLNTRTGRQETVIETYAVFFRSLTPQNIDHYLDHEDVLGCAGSFKSEGLGCALFQKMKGDDPTSLMGLPLIKLAVLLENQGIYVLN